ncbi:MAG: His-Xaa-Ser system protein HxsD [Candidatus Woesearchaeota archaeon]
MKTLNGIGNIKIENDFAIITINPEIYPVEVIYSAAYIMMDRSFIILDKNKDKIIVEIRNKIEGKENIKSLVNEFFEELLNYSVYKIQSEKNAPIREAIMKRIFATNLPNEGKKKK